MKSALEDDLESLRKSIAAEQKSGRIDRGRARDIARAVLEREVISAAGSQGLTRLTELDACANELTQALRERAESRDDIGAEASLILLENKKLGGSPLETYGSSPDGAFRALAARDTESERARGKRRAFFVDDDERVRRAALKSAIAAPDPRDAEPLLEVTRLDPDPLARRLAILALGHIGTERVVLALKDRWPRFDEPLQSVIIEALRTVPAWNDGGRHELLRLVETSSGLLALEAAEAFRDDEAWGIALQKLLAAARQGSTEERRLALAHLPADHPEAQGVLRKTASDSDRDVQVIASSRLLELESDRAAAQKTLRSLARGDGTAALEAQEALAASGDDSITPLLRERLGKADAKGRKVAGLGLLRLARFNDAASVFADRSPQVRVEVACTFIAPAKPSP